MATTIAPTTTPFPIDPTVDDAQACLIKRIYNINCVNNRIGDNWEQLLLDPEFRDAQRLWVGIRAVPILEVAEDWNRLETTLNLLRTIIAKYE